MTPFPFILAIALSLTLPLAKAESGRDFQVIAALGVEKHFSKAVSGGGTSNFEGWSPTAEFGIEIPWSSNSGVAFTGEYKMLDLTNISTSTTLIERAEGSSQALKLSLFFNQWAFGGGMSQDALNIRQVSTVTGATETQLSGPTSVAFLNYSINTKPFGRLVFEAQHRSGVLNAVTFTDISLAMKFALLLDF